MSEFETWPSRGDETLPLTAKLWMRRAATAERVAGNLNSRRDSELLANYAEECYAEAWRAIASGSGVERRV
ncbi:MAG TPA: hypothetical protein VGB82_14465 [Alphaproteobacteria bacterium]